MGATREPSGELSTAIAERVSNSAGVVATFALVIADGEGRGTRFILDGGAPSRVLAGKSPACSVLLPDPTVSRRHAAFEPSPDGLRLVDLGSTNGTLVNGIRITDVFLRGGETITLGHTSLHVEALATTAPIAASEEWRFGRVLGKSVQMRRLYPLCEKIAASNVPVILEGETGTGKEVLAEAIHERSRRSGKPFVVFDCTAVPPNLLESALFGHERGAFTGAVSARRGVFEQAHGGTLLIDEVGDLELSLQPKLLRAIERAEVQRVGSERWLKVDVRIIAATRRDLDQEVQAGRFRDDLFFRLAVTRIELPPLRERKGDIAVLARHFWDELGGVDLPFPDDILPRLEAYAWPGNVRELHNAIARRLALGELSRDEGVPWRAPGAQTASADFMEGVLGQDLPLARARQAVVDEFEKRYVARVLARYDGSVSRAAAASGIKRRYFQVLRARHGRDEP